MISIYYKQISRYHPLTQEQEQTLIVRIQQGDMQARQTLIEGNLRLVTNIARQYFRPNIELLDLIQEGNIGLIEAVDRFDPQYGNRFSTFAVWWIKKAILEFLGEGNKIVSLDIHFKQEDKQVCLSDTIEDTDTILGGPSCQPMDLLLQQQEDLKDLNIRLASLPKREKEVLNLLYGIESKKPMSLQEVADLLNISHERVRCIKDTALGRLR